MFIMQLYLVCVIGLMITVGIIKELNLFSDVYLKFSKYVKSKKWFVFFYSLISGILPIQGRSLISAAFLDTIAPKDKKKRAKFGLIDYLSTHHYYFWSPLEQTVLIPMVGLSLSYFGFLSYIWPLLLAYLMFLVWYLRTIKEDDVELNFSFEKRSCWHVAPLLLTIVSLVFGYKMFFLFMVLPFYYMLVTKTYKLKKLNSYINWKLLVFMSIILFLTELVKVYIVPLDLTILSLGMGLLLAWIFTFLFGSSAKFAGFIVLLCSMFGVQWLTLFFAIEFSAYLVSPMHKCIVITKEYFGTSLSTFYKVVGMLGLMIILAGLAYTLVVLL